MEEIQESKEGRSWGNR